MKKSIVDQNENKTDATNKELEDVKTSSDNNKDENDFFYEKEKILIIDGQKYEFIKSIPGTGFKSKEEEEEFVNNLFNYEDEEDEYDIYNTPNMGLRA